MLAIATAEATVLWRVSVHPIHTAKDGASQTSFGTASNLLGHGLFGSWTASHHKGAAAAAGSRRHSWDSHRSLGIRLRASDESSFGAEGSSAGKPPRATKAGARNAFPRPLGSDRIGSDRTGAERHANGGADEEDDGYGLRVEPFLSLAFGAKEGAVCFSQARCSLSLLLSDAALECAHYGATLLNCLSQLEGSHDLP